MTDLEQQLTDHLRRRAATATPRHNLEAIEQTTNLITLIDLEDHRPRRPAIRVVAIAACLLAVVVLAAVVMAERRSVDTVPPSESPTTEPSTATTEAGGPRTLARAKNVKIWFAGLPADVELIGADGLAGQTLSIDAVEQGGEVTGEFRVNNVVVTLQCADTRLSTGSYTRRELSLGGEVTANPDGLVTLDGVNVAVGDLVALVIREEDLPGPQRVTLYNPTMLPPPRNASAGSCSELVASAGGLDGGSFADVADGYDIETQPFSPTLAKGEDVAIGGFGGLAGQTLNIDAEREHGEVTGEFRVNNVVVTLQCADTDTIDGETRLGGQVTADPDGQGLVTPDGVRVAVGDRVALIIREHGPDFDMVSLYANDSAGSCTDLVKSVPYNLDGGYFNEVDDGGAIETGGTQFNP